MSPALDLSRPELVENARLHEEDPGELLDRVNPIVEPEGDKQ